MAGLIILGVVFVYFGFITVFISMAFRSKGRKRWVAIVCLLGAILIPFGDVPFDKYRFNRLCEKEGGIFVYQRVGLPKEFYLRVGEPTKKTIYREDGGISRRTVSAIGSELKIEKLRKTYLMDDSDEYDIAPWGEVVKSTTKIMNDDLLLGEAISFIGGAGWLEEWLSQIFTGRPGTRCPDYLTNGSSVHEQIIYDIFYKVGN